MKVIGCLGETLEEREKGKTFEVVFRQIKAYANVIKENEWNNFVIAYEVIFLWITILISLACLGYWNRKNCNSNTSSRSTC